MMRKKEKNIRETYIETILFLFYSSVFLFMSFMFVDKTFSFTEQEFKLLLAKTPTHKIVSNNPNGCKTCHGGVGYSAKQEEEVCHMCHGERIKATKRQEKAKLKPLVASNVRRDFEKPYRHPVEKRGLHSEGEKFPVIDPNIPRHAECLDCHNPHYSIPEIPLLAVSGVDSTGKFTRHNLAEYEVCFKCHGADSNKPVYQKNKVREFDPKNPSFHPVVEAGKNNYLPSLEKGLTFETIIQCSSCHGSDEKGSKKLRGVHGSRNEYILVLPYTRTEETSKPQYDLCYKCHRKESILDNQSFSYHREHIEGVKSRNWKGTSCSTCHNVHGSIKYKFLIEFNPDYVTKETVSNKLEFASEGVFKGACYLKCHNIEHGPKSYGK